jgi:hypothetical protein
MRAVSGNAIVFEKRQSNFVIREVNVKWTATVFMNVVHCYLSVGY